MWFKTFLRASFLFLAILISQVSFGQELNCDVQITLGNVQSVDNRVITEMKKAIKDFMSQRRWTNDNFNVEERIKCTIYLTLSGTVGNYTAQAQIIASRPIYGTTYESVLIKVLDQDWGFQYVEGQPLDFQQGTFTTNLTSLLAYYAYIIIGLDYDTFSKLGGKNYYNLAQQVGQNATQGGLKGWNQFDGTNTRYFYLENLMSQQFAGFREALYTFYRKGLDNHLEKPEETRSLLLEVLRKLKVAFDQRPTSFLINSYLDAKADEFINIMKESIKPEEKQEAFTILSQIDPTKIEKYQKLIK